MSHNLQNISQQMQSNKLRNKAIINFDNRLFQFQESKKSSFPSINLTSTSRALMALSKRQKADDQNNFLYSKLGMQMLIKNQQLALLKTNKNNQQKNSKILQNQKSMSKLNKTLYFTKKFEKIQRQSKSQSKLQLKKIHKIHQKHKQENYHLNQKEQNKPYNSHSKFSYKNIGFVDGYAASSHIGKINTVNNTRICIATNLFCSSIKSRQLSFFAIFQGRNGSNRAQYMRENFHNILINDELAVLRTIDKINKDFDYNPKNQGDYSVVNSVICVIMGSRMYMIRWGGPNAVISMNFGSYIKTLYPQAKQNKALDLKHRNSVTSLSYYKSEKHPSQQSVSIRLFELNQNFDFILLTNEGLNQVYNSKNQLGKIFWKCILEEPAEMQKDSFNRLCKACNKICQKAAKSDTLGRSMSMIAIQFKNTGLCFQGCSQLQLPYVQDKNCNQSRFSTKDEYNLNLDKQVTHRDRNLQKIKNLMNTKLQINQEQQYLPKTVSTYF